MGCVSSTHPNTETKEEEHTEHTASQPIIDAVQHDNDAEEPTPASNAISQNKESTAQESTGIDLTIFENLQSNQCFIDRASNGDSNYIHHCDFLKRIVI